jgi:hypothetical protein
MELGSPITAQYDVTDDLAIDMIAIRKFALKLGSTPLEVSGTVNAKPKRRRLASTFRATNVSIAEAAKPAAVSGVALSQGTVGYEQRRREHPSGPEPQDAPYAERFSRRDNSRSSSSNVFCGRIPRWTNSCRDE